MAEYNNNYSKKDVSTDTLTFFSDKMMLQIRMLESALSLSFRPLSVDDTGKRSFPKVSDSDRFKYSVLITKEKAEELLSRLNQSFVPRLLETVDSKFANPDYTRKPFSNGVFINSKNNTRVLDFYSGELSGDITPSLRLISDINEDRIPAHVVEYVFSNAPVINDYDIKTGEFQMYPSMPQLLLFKRLLDSFLMAITCSAGHSVSLVFKNELDHITDTTDQIAIQNNIPIVKFNATVDYNTNSRPNTFIKSNSKMPGAEIVEVASFDELTSLDLPL